MSTQPQKRILVVSKQDLLIDVVSIFLEGVFQATVEVADNSRQIEAIFEQNKHTGLDLLLVEDERLLVAAGKAIGDFLAPTILLGTEQPAKQQSGRKCVFLKKPLDLESLMEAIRSFSQLTGGGKREYCQVRLDTLLLAGREMQQDVFRKDGEKHELVLKKGEAFDPQNPDHFELRKQKFLFLRFEDFTAFLSGFAQQLQRIAEDKTDALDLGAATAVAGDVHQMLAQTLPELGFTPELQQATRASIDMAVAHIQKDTRLAELLAALSKSESEYLSWHSVALCFVACRLSSLMTWDSPNTHYKLSLAAFLHDLTVKIPALARVESDEELRKAAASKEEKEEFRDHPHAAAAYARQMADFPGDVDHIVAQHHELPSGKGFPLGITHTKISPLAAVFIIAHEITDELYDKRKKFNLKECVADLEQKYTQGYFRRVVAALTELSKKESSL